MPTLTPPAPRTPAIPAFRRRSRLAALALLPLALAFAPLASAFDYPPVKPPLDENKPLVWQDPDIVGAKIDESSVRAEVLVDPSARASDRSVPTLAEAFARARETLAKGVPTLIRIKAGTYRESLDSLGIDQGVAKTTLLVIEGEAPGRVILSGADVFPAAAWKNESDGLYSHPWTHRFGNVSPKWGPPRLLGHRSEMVFIGESPLRQIILDDYDTKGLSQALKEDKSPPSWTYRETYSPRERLRPGEFGVTEHGEDGGRLYIRLAPGEKLPAAGVEVAVRQNLIHFGNRGDLVLRNLVITRAANNLSRSKLGRPLAFGGVGDFGRRNVLIERCAFRWNNGTGLDLSGAGWTLRDNTFNYNGALGITSWGASEMLWERNQTNFNAWRVWRGGEIAWFSGGVKLHYTKRHWVRGHHSIGNIATGFHYDIACNDIWNEDLVLIDNVPGGLGYEISSGPFHARRVLSTGGSMNFGTTARIWSAQGVLIQDSVFYNNYGGRGWAAAEPAVMFDVILSRRKDHAARMDDFLGSLVRVERSLFAIGADQPRLLSIADRRPEAAPEEVFRWIGRDNVFAFGRPQTDGDFKLRERGAQPRFGPLEAWKSFPHVDEQNLQIATESLRDPERGDFRPVAHGPVGALAPRLPAYRMPPEVLAARDAYFAWVGFDRRGGDLTANDDRARAASAELGRIDPLD
jgi:hypothetical protein